MIVKPFTNPLINYIGRIKYFKILLGARKPIISINEPTLFKFIDANQEQRQYKFGIDKDYKTPLDTKAKILYDVQNNEQIGHITYIPSYGQIGRLCLNQNFQGYGLGKQMLDQAIHDINKIGQTDQICTFAEYEDPFWSKLPGSRYKIPPDKVFHDGGYTFKIKDYEFTEVDAESIKIEK